MSTDSSRNISSKDAIIANAIEIFSQQLRQWNRKRAPPGLEQKLKEASHADRTNTARIFLEHGGLQAWLAYSTATEGRAHFSGRRDRDNAIEAFRALPLHDRIDAARKVALLDLPTTVSEHISFISRRLRLKGRLPATHEDAGLPPSAHAPDATPLTYCELARNGHGSATISSVAIRASLDGIAQVFGEYMCRVIKRVTVLIDDGSPSVLKAAVTMQFPDFALHDCVMTLEVCDTEVERLLKDLFGIDVELRSGIRHLDLGKGVKLTANPEITLKGVKDELIIRFFGAEIYEAIAASRMRKTEVEEDKSRPTECVSVIFTSKCGERAFVNLSLGLEEGSRIRKRLYS